MRNFTIFTLIFTLFVYSCGTYELKDPQRYDYVTSGALTDDCFQVIITVSPDRELKTMADQRENAFIKAKDSITTETEKQILSYYSSERSLSIENLPVEKLKTFKEQSIKYSRLGIIDQEYYLMDNSAVLIYRIFKKGIKSEILNN